MDRLSLFKLLADGSRFAIYQQVAGAGEPLSTSEISARLRLHPNTVRVHLEKMRDAGLVAAAPDRHGTVGRPQYRWTAVEQAPSLGLEPAGSRLLARMLAELAARSPGAAAGAAEVGRLSRSEHRARQHPPLGAAPRVACLRAIVDELAELGFDPAVEPEEALAGGEGWEVASISFTRCPFRELAALYPDVVCELHRGLTEGIASAVGDAAPASVRVESFSSLVDEDPCRVEVSVVPA